MKQELKEYIQSIRPVGFPDGKEMVQEGRNMAKEIPWNHSRFLDENGYDTWEAYVFDCHKRGKEVFTILMGLSTLEEQLDALKKIEEFYRRTGEEVRSVQMIPSQLCGMPLEYWENAPKQTSYCMGKEEDWKVHADAAAVDVCWEDWHLSSPNNLKETIYALKAGSSRMGSFGQFIWEYPGWHDEKKRFSDMCRSMGILAAYRDKGMTVASYPEDGIAGYFMDVVSMLGYVMIEHYIIEDLCGARMTMGYGGLLSELVPRVAFGLACEELYGGKNRQFLTYYNGSTNTHWDHDIEANYGIGALEMLIQAVMNLKYDLAVTHKPVSITEAVRVPTLEELLNITRCGMGAMSRAKEWMDIIDFTKFEEMRDLLIEKAEIFYNNILEGFREAGVDINDPMEMILTLKRFDPVKLETEFHPSLQVVGEFRPYVSTVLYNQTLEIKNKEVASLMAKGYGNVMNGKKVVCVSADGHSYGLLLIRNLWNEMCAEVVNGGINMEPATVLDLADEEDTDLIAISIHCGQCLDYSRQIMELARRRGKKYRIVVGGVLNSMMTGYTEPVDVSDLVIEMGICASNDFEMQINMFCID